MVDAVRQQHSSTAATADKAAVGLASRIGTTPLADHAVRPSATRLRWNRRPNGTGAGRDGRRLDSGVAQCVSRYSV